MGNWESDSPKNCLQLCNNIEKGGKSPKMEIMRNKCIFAALQRGAECHAGERRARKNCLPGRASGQWFEI